MNTFQKRYVNFGVPFAITLIFSITLFSCSTDDPVVEEEEMAQEDASEDKNAEDTGDGQNQNEGDGSGGESEQSTSCTNPENFVFVEKDGLVAVEFEASKFGSDWSMKSNEPDFSGDGFLVWSGGQSLSNPGNGLITFKIKIENTGTYQFLWNSAVTIGNNGTEHNDTWLRFTDADDFYGFKQNGNSTVYPQGTGKSPNPNGASKDGWFKIYRSGSDLGFKWQARTSDHDAHDIFVQFDTPGTYTMEVSARSSGHALDKFVLFKDPYTVGDATGEVELSAIECN